MGVSNGQQPSKRGNFNTLGQSDTPNYLNLNSQPSMRVHGNGTDLTQKRAMDGRAKRKLITKVLTLKLVDVAKAKGDKKMEKAYWNAYHCQEKLISADGRIYGHYCKNRFCTLCNANRKAELINKYLPIIKTWDDPQFVTLTVLSVKERNLKKWVDAMFRAFTIIKKRCYQRHRRGKGVKLVGVKSLECNFNPKTKTYNPHFHLIVANNEVAETLRVEWQRQWNKDGNKTDKCVCPGQAKGIQC